MRGALEDDRDLGDAAAEPLAGAQVEGDARPAAVVDLQLDRGIGVGLRLGVDAVFLEVADDLLAALPAVGVLAAHGLLAEVLGQPDGAQHLGLLRHQRVRVEGGGLLHGGQREQLQQVVLDDVTGGADAVVVARAAADADVLGHGDLHMVDEGPVPDRLEEGVGEAQRQDVLDRLLAQVVVDPEDLFRREDLVDDPVELLGAGQVVPEGLLDDGAPPGALLLVGQAVLLQLLDDLGEELGRYGQVEGEVAARALRLVQFLDGRLEGVEGLVVVEVALDEAAALHQLLPDLLAEGGARVLLDGRVHLAREVLVGPGAAGEADQGETRRKQSPVGQVVDRRHQLFFLDKSPVTPKMTRPDGPAMRGSRRS
ncbi:hypothetical protein GCM10020000_61920 [Streptomyces olivoverticillatus]